MSASDIHELIHGSHGESQRFYQKIRDEKEKQMNNFIGPWFRASTAVR